MYALISGKGNGHRLLKLAQFIGNYTLCFIVCFKCMFLCHFESFLTYIPLILPL